MSVAYFIRRAGDVCSVIKLYADNRKEVYQDGLTLIEAEILCVTLIEDIPKRATPQEPESDQSPVESGAPKRRNARPRQLTFKF
jgi:hypothetical protein